MNASLRLIRHATAVVAHDDMGLEVLACYAREGCRDPFYSCESRVTLGQTSRAHNSLAMFFDVPEGAGAFYSIFDFCQTNLFLACKRNVLHQYYILVSPRNVAFVISSIDELIHSEDVQYVLLDLCLEAWPEQRTTFVFSRCELECNEAHFVDIVDKY